MALVLTLVAVPLSKLRPRQGRYARVGFAIVVYFVYSNLLSAAEVWLEKSELPPSHRRVVGACRGLGARLVPGDARREEGVNTLDRYLYRTVLAYTLMAMAVLLALGALVVFISQQGDIGVGSYSAGDAFLFTLLNLPQSAFELLPIGAMIGALMGLGICLGQRTCHHARLGRVGLAHRVAGGSCRHDARGHHVRHRRIRGAADGAIREARKNHRQIGRTSVSRARAAHGSRTAIASCGCIPAKWIGRSAESRFSNWMARRACAPSKERRASRLPIPEAGACTMSRLPGSTNGQSRRRYGRRS